MATAQAAPMWHTRGAWSAREDRAASAVCLAILWVGMVAGFGLDMPRFLAEKPPAPMVVHVHAFVFTGWLLLVTAQVGLVLGDRVAWHRRLGWFAAGWACLMAVLGPWAAFATQAMVLADPSLGQSTVPPTGFLAVNLVAILGFVLLLAWGIALRKNPAAHRRIMMLATIALADPGFGRITGHYLPEPKHVPLWFVESFYGNVLLVALLLLWDWRRGRLMRPFALGASALLGAEFLASALYFWPPWQALTRMWVEAYMRL
ncbi:MAG TPA: hypothetical protein VG893_15115 [Terracidiphilus sp.]|nr:hypothetical protein [Terracidiphilus sp.]